MSARRQGGYKLCGAAAGTYKMCILEGSIYLFRYRSTRSDRCWSCRGSLLKLLCSRH